MIYHPSAYFQPNILFQWIPFMPQLEMIAIAIAFTFPVPNRDVEGQLTHTPITTPITLPNLRWFWFQGVGAYLGRFFVGLLPLASKGRNLTSSSNSRFLFHLSCSL